MQQGLSKRRTWCKLHLAVNEATGEILSSVVTGNSCNVVMSADDD